MSSRSEDNEASTEVDEVLAARLRDLAAALQRAADTAEAGTANPEDVDDLLRDVRVLFARRYGARVKARRGEGARTKIRRYLLQHVGEQVTGDELAAVSGIQEWARRLRELRVEEGYDIVEVGDSTYCLRASEPDADAARRWRLMNDLRRRPGSALSRIQAFLTANVGAVVTRTDIDYVANIAEGSRRMRELRDEHGWPIASHIDDPALRAGEYRLLSADPADRRDPLQRLYPETVRQAVFERDHYTCQICKRNRVKAEAAGDRRFYLEVHHKIAVADELAALPKVERNKLGNLVTLCHADHLRETAVFQRGQRSGRRGGGRA